MIKTQLTALLAGALFLASSNAWANTITPSPVIFVPGVSMTYQASLTSGHLEAGDGFTIFDFGGYTGLIALPTDWALGSSDPLNNPWGIAPGGVDDPLLPNLTFVYTGAPVHQEFGGSTFGGFVIGTTDVFTAPDDWTSRDHNITPVGDTYVLGEPHTDQILVPSAQPGPLPPVPDGAATLGLLGLALIAIAQLRVKLSA